jgi:adhesin transport system outer membrane protein
MAAFVMVASHGAGARAQSLQESLSFMIEDHKRIRAAESDLASARNTAIASLGGWFPTLDVTAFYGLEEQRKPDATDTKFYPRQVEFTLTQFLWDFGATNGTIRAAKRTYDQAQAILTSTLQSLILEGVTAHVNLIRANELVRFALISEENIKRQTELEDARVQRGSGFSTDVLQAKTQLAGSQARRVQAEGALQNARNRYRAVFYRDPGDLQSLVKPRPPIDMLPASLDETIEIAMENNPQLRAQLIAADIARETVNQTRATELFPTLNAIGTSTYKQDVQGTSGFKGEQLIKVELTYSLNLGMTQVNTLRAAKSAYSAAEDRYGDARIQIKELVRNAWQNFLTAKDNAEALRNQANIANEFLELARKERQLGRRSLIDVLAGETALINSNSDAVSAETDVVLAVYNLVSVMGFLELDVVE